MKDNCYVSRTQVYLGKLVLPLNELKNKDKQHFSNYTLCRNIIYTPSGYNYGIDLVYKCPNYPIASKSNNEYFVPRCFLETPSVFNGVIISGVNIQEILKRLAFKDILSTKDIFRLKKILSDSQALTKMLKDYQSYLQILQKYNLGYEPHLLETGYTYKRKYRPWH